MKLPPLHDRPSGHPDAVPCSTAETGIRWRWLVMGIIAVPAGLLFVPALGHPSPMQEWLSLVLFPYFEGLPALWEPLRSLQWLLYITPFPIYGLILTLASRGPHLRLWFYALLVIHTLIACSAAVARYYR